MEVGDGFLQLAGGGHGGADFGDLLALLLILREGAGEHREAAQRFADVSGLVRRERHAAVLISEGADAAAFRNELGVDLKFADKFTGCTTHARESSSRIRASLKEIFHRGECLSDAAEIELVEGHRRRERIGTVADCRQEGELATAADIAVGELTAELCQADGLFVGLSPHDDFLGTDTVGLRRTNRQLERAALVGPEWSAVRSGGCAVGGNVFFGLGQE